MGAWTYLAAWDVHRARVFGRCEVKSGIAPVNRLVGEVMGQEPYKSARRVFWIVDNCSAHRGQKAANRLRDRWGHPGDIVKCCVSERGASLLNDWLGGLLGLFFAIDESNADDDLGDEFKALESTPMLLGFQGEFKDHRQGRDP